MNTIINNTKKDPTLLIKKRDINLNGEIFPHILLELIENTLIKPVADLENIYDIKAIRSNHIYKVEIIGKAFPGDVLKVHTQLGKFNKHIAIFNIQIMKKNKKSRQAIICKASFSYKIEHNLVVDKIAS